MHSPEMDAVAARIAVYGGESEQSVAAAVSGMPDLDVDAVAGLDASSLLSLTQADGVRI